MQIKKLASNSLNFIIKGIVQTSGLFITFKGLFLLICLLSYSPEDPNFIFPKNTEIQEKEEKIFNNLIMKLIYSPLSLPSKLF